MFVVAALFSTCLLVSPVSPDSIPVELTPEHGVLSSFHGYSGFTVGDGSTVVLDVNAANLRPAPGALSLGRLDTNTPRMQLDPHIVSLTLSNATRTDAPKVLSQPGILLLVGSALAGLGGWTRRRLQKRVAGPLAEEARCASKVRS